MRFPLLDAYRGLSVVMMVVFHLAYDLKIFGLVSWNFASGFWYAFPRFIAASFLFCVGMSLNYLHQQQFNWQALKKRSLLLGGAALLISVSTYLLFPDRWIYFGTLHCIFLGSLVGSLFIHRRSWATILMFLIILLQYGFDFDIKWVSSWLNRPSMDFIPLYPWVWVILLGLLTGPYLSQIRRLQQIPDIPFLSFLGRHSLKIYLIHQPLLYGAAALLKSLVGV